MAIETQGGYNTAGGPALPVTIVNAALPAVGAGTAQDVAITDAPTGDSAQQVQGTAGDTTQAVGNPVRVAGQDVNGAVQTILTDAAGRQYAVIAGSTGTAVVLVTASADGASASTTMLPAAAFPRLYNGATFDRQRNNSDLTILASSARTATNNSADQTNYNGRRLLLFVNISAGSGFTLTPSLQVKDSISGNYSTVWTAAATLTATGIYVYLFDSGASGGSYKEVIAAGLAARTFRVVMTHLDTTSATYSVSGTLSV